MKRAHLAQPLRGRLSALDGRQLDALQVFIEVPVLSSAYEAYPGTDFELVMLLGVLVDKGIVVIA